MSTRRDPSGTPITPVHGASRGPSAGLALGLLAIAVAAAIAVAVLSGPGPAPMSSAVARASVAPTASSPAPGRSASPVPAPSATRAPGAATTVLVVRDLADPAAAFGRLLGCSTLQRTVDQPTPGVRGAVVDATARAAGRDSGWLFVPPGIQGTTKVWLGDDVVALARAVGVPLVSVGGDGEVWLGGPAGATRWRPIATPEGRTAWLMTPDEVTAAGTCGSWPVPGTIDRQRAVSCSGMAPDACLQLLPLLGSATTSALEPGGDLVVALAPCIDSHRCFVAPLTFVAVPPGWSGALGDLRVPAPADSSLDRAPAGGGLPDYALDTVGRPALPLPLNEATATRGSCAEELAGPLRGAPWDPRVAWIGSTAVAWPAGTTVRFLPGATLRLPGLAVPARSGTALELTGRLDPATRTFHACAAVGAAATAASPPSPGPLDGRGTGS